MKNLDMVTGEAIRKFHRAWICRLNLNKLYFYKGILTQNNVGKLSSPPLFSIQLLAILKRVPIYEEENKAASTSIFAP